ncbi:MAG: tRNA uridine-5-carboxymethylaminomethyl(34) synthesis GTPase MnmE [Nitrospirota bacterium]|jgi:tRNA modification GTPase
MKAYHMTGGDTIAAPATPPGEGGIGIVRISGPRALGIAERLFASPRGRRPESHRALYGHIVEPETGEPVDEVLLLYMKAPRTYTREDVVEVHCHGGMVPLSRVLSLALAQGARLAEPGEFTRRAFLAGRLDLCQAEAALDLIRAKTEAAGHLALSQLEGGLSGRVRELREMLLLAAAHLEASIDFPEEEMELASMEEMRRLMEAARDGAASLAGTFREGRLFRDGVKTAIVGRPNVGKSSLLNALLSRSRAIVAEMPGTTRDVIEEHLSIRGLPLLMMDTAGIRGARDMVEEEGVKRSLKALTDADLVLAVLDASVPLAPEDRLVLDRLSDRNAVLVLNKCDLPMAWEETLLGNDSFPPRVRTSAREGRGLEDLKDAIQRAALGSGAFRSDGVLVTTLRHKAALDGARRFIEAALDALASEPPEITAVELREAMDRLAEIGGEVTTEDVLERIFSEFCIGK